MSEVIHLGEENKMIKLEKITHNNFQEVLNIKLTDTQNDCVNSSIYCLAEAYVDIINNEKPPMLFAIYNNGEVIGLVEMGFYELKKDSFLWKEFGDKYTYEVNTFLIDERYQGKGFGKEAMNKVIEFLRTFPQGEADSITLSYWMTNDAARRLYASMGFVETGDVWDGETFEAWDTERADLENAEVGARLELK